MKILHTADWHLGNYVGPQCDSPGQRMENTRKCLKVLIDTAKDERPDIILVAGDIFHQARVWSDRALIEVSAAADYLDALSQWAPVVVLYGTPNHDGEQQFRALMQMTNGEVHYFMEPGIRQFKTSSGLIQVAGLPGFDKGHFRAQYPGMSAEDENRIFTEQLAAIVEGLSAQVDPSIPSVLMAHHTVVGSRLDNGQHVFQTNEVILDTATLDNSSFELICLGHIHKAQRVDTCQNKPVFYSGSIDAFTFNDEGWEKGFWMHELYPKKDDNWKSSKFYETPAREFLTLKWDEDEFEIYTDYELSKSVFSEIQGKIVRILYTCDSETEKALNKKHIERDLYAAGAYYVSEIRPEKIHEVVNKERLNEKFTVSDCLERYLKEKVKSESEISQLMGEAVNIVTETSANLPAGNQTGVFLPLEIEVHNYRSYAEEKLSFQDIFFAMVNGRNGSGKSSLFMDAIVDCLYEQPREGELTGWIRNGEKSGAITFTFQLGSDIYRVTRTRQKSGRATLAIAKMEYGQYNDGAEDDSGQWHEAYDWQDISCQKLTDTQQKIIQLLGMDADTFRSCVLIMQDQYGRFMESKPEDRMSVLASLLGLGVYEQLEDETKKALTEVNRSLRGAKEDLSTLEQDVDQITGLQSLLDTKRDELRTAEATLMLLKQQKDEAAAKVATFGQVLNEKARFLQEAVNKEARANVKNKKLDELTKNVAQTQAFLETEEDLNNKYDELLETRQQLAAMNSKAKMAKDKQLHVGKLATELSNLTMEKRKLETDIQSIQERLQGADKIRESFEQLDGIEDTLASWEEKEKKDREYHESLSIYRGELDKIRQHIDFYTRHAAILEHANCIDIDNAQCGFLKAAKEAKSKLEGLSAKEIEKQEIILRIANERLALGYNSEQHQVCKEAAQDYRKTKQQLASLEGDKKLLEVHNIRYAEVINRISAAGGEKELLETELHALQQELSRYYNLKAKIGMLEQSEQQWQQLSAAKKYLEAILPQMDELAKEIEQLQVEIQYSKDKAAELSVQIKDLQKYQDELQLLNRSISDYEATVASYNRTIGSLEEKFMSLMHKKDVLEETKKGLKELAVKAARLQVLAEAFSQDGIPHQIIREIIPEIESSTNNILGQMTGGRMRLEFRTERTLKSNKSKEVATLDIVIIDVDNGELPYLSRSGGQKVRAALAVSFALAMVKASRVGLQLGMMFVDEPPFLDAEGIEAYCMALESIHEKYSEMRILAISHDENMKARFPQQLTVVETENGSKVMKG